MRFLFGLLFVLGLATALGIGLAEDPGYVLIRLGDWRLESSAALLAALVVIGYLALGLLLQGLRLLWQGPRRLRQWRDQRRLDQARTSLEQGLAWLAAGRWRQAERRLLTHIADSPRPQLRYLAAAWAAQAQGAWARCCDYLQRADACDGDPAAVDLLRAELALLQGESGVARKALEQRHRAQPEHPLVLRRLALLREQDADWDGLQSLLPALRRHQALPAAGIDELEARLYRGRLARAIAAGDADALQAVRGALPSRLAIDPGFLYIGCCGLAHLGRVEAALQSLVPVVRRHWQPALIELYGQLADVDPERQLQILEDWLAGHPRDPALLRALGQVATRAGLWGKARHYLESAIAIEPDARGYRLLGELLERLGEGGAATVAYRRGLDSRLEPAAACAPPGAPVAGSGSTGDSAQGQLPASAASA